jgi:hypothetical protein
MCYYTLDNVLFFNIKMASGSVISGSDAVENLHRIAESYEVKTIERID